MSNKYVESNENYKARDQFHVKFLVYFRVKLMTFILKSFCANDFT